MPSSGSTVISEKERHVDAEDEQWAEAVGRGAVEVDEVDGSELLALTTSGRPSALRACKKAHTKKGCKWVTMKKGEGNNVPRPRQPGLRPCAWPLRLVWPSLREGQVCGAQSKVKQSIPAFVEVVETKSGPA